MIKPNLLAIALFLLICMGNLSATTYYVDNAGGDDGNSGTSITSAWSSLSKVNSFGFNSGDTVSFKCGDRFSGVTITGKSNITFNSYGSGPRPVIDGQGAMDCFYLESQTNIVFNGLKIVNGGGGDIKQNISLWNTSHVLIESCNIDSSRGANIHNVGIYAGGGSSYLTVRNSTLSYGEQTSGTGNLGIYIDGCDNTLMEYDTLDGNFSGIRVAMGGTSLDTSNHSANWTDNLIVRYCVIENGKWDGIDDDGSFNAMYYYNVFINNKIEVYQFTNGDSQWQTYSAMYAHYYNNTFIHSGSDGIFEYTPPSDISGQVISTGLTCINNIFYNSGSNMIYHPWGTPAKEFNFDHNIWYSTAGGKWEVNGNTISEFDTWQGLGYDINGKFTDPMFINIDNGDYTLQGNSPAINSGINVGLTKDINGTPIPSGNPDIGAHQMRLAIGGGPTGGGVKIAISVESQGGAIPKEFAIKQNYPNPFNPTTKIDYQVPTDSKVILEVYNIAGQKVAELVNQDLPAGFYSVNFGATSKLASGVYIYRINASDKASGKIFSDTKKMMLLK